MTRLKLGGVVPVIGPALAEFQPSLGWRDAAVTRSITYPSRLVDPIA